MPIKQNELYSTRTIMQMTRHQLIAVLDNTENWLDMLESDKLKEKSQRKFVDKIRVELMRRGVNANKTN